MTMTRRSALQLSAFTAAGLASGALSWDETLGQTRRRSGRLARALCLGLNAVNAADYDGWDGELTGCVPDVDDMSRELRARGFEVRTLWDKESARRNDRPDDVATRRNVTDWITRATREMNDGDIFVITYSGHGGQFRDGNQDERDGLDETWCLYDGEQVDDERADLWHSFKRGVRIVAISDSCHSGSFAKVRDYASSMMEDVSEVTKKSRSRKRSRGQKTSENEPGSHIRDALERHGLDRNSPAERAGAEGRGPAPIRQMPETVRQRLLRDDDYSNHMRNIQSRIPRSRASFDDIPGRVLAIGACQDNQTSADGSENGLFTGTLLEVWRGLSRNATYLDFFAEIRRNMPYYQVPNLEQFGRGGNFDSQAAFSV